MRRILERKIVKMGSLGKGGRKLVGLRASAGDKHLTTSAGALPESPALVYGPPYAVEARIAEGDSLGQLVLFDESERRMHLAVVGVPGSGRRNGLDSFSLADYCSASLTGGGVASGFVRVRRTASIGATLQAIFNRQAAVTAVGLQIKDNKPKCAIYLGAALHVDLIFSTVMTVNAWYYLGFRVVKSTGEVWARLYDSSGAAVETKTGTMTAGTDVDAAYFIGRAVSGNELVDGEIAVLSIADGTDLGTATLDAIVAADANGTPPRIFGLPEWRGLAGGLVNEGNPAELIREAGAGADVTAEYAP